MSKEKRLPTTRQKRKKGLLTRRTKELEEPEEQQRLVVYEYMENGTLFDHLHADQGSSTLSPVTVSWKMRIDVLLGVSRAIEHLHCHANPPIIHRDIKPSNILFGANWVPRVSDFGLSLVWDMASEVPWLDVTVRGTLGYIDLEYVHTGHLTPASDVSSLGMVMLGVLTGKKAFSQAEEEMNIDLASFALPIIEAGTTEEMLDKRPVPEPTPSQLHALKRVAQIARCCVKFAGNDRPAISGIVANLETACELMFPINKHITIQTNSSIH